MSDPTFHSRGFRSRGSKLLLATISVLSLSACDSTPEGRVAVHPVSGQVQFQGKPLSGAVVTFYPADEGQVGKDVPRPTGRTNAEGKYELTTYALADGAPTGSYLVAISSLPPPKTETGLFNNLKAPLPVDILKGKYLDPQKSGLKAELKEDTSQVPPFDLK